VSTRRAWSPTEVAVTTFAILAIVYVAVLLLVWPQ
jgi:hypothetical protein